MNKYKEKGFTPVKYFQRKSSIKDGNFTGFTLIELLIVIGIIAILAAAVIVAINPGQQFAAARDATRESHLNSINNAILSYQVDNTGTLPTGITTSPKEICRSDVETCPGELIDLSEIDGDYISSLPVDPQGGIHEDGTGYFIKEGSVVLVAEKAETRFIGIGIAEEKYELAMASVRAEDTAPDCTTVVDTYSGGGTEANPYLIEEFAQLQCIEEKDLSAVYQLFASFDASPTEDWNGGEGFEPIGDSDNPFTGTIDGQGKFIYGLTINRPNVERVGLFGVIRGGDVRDLLFDNADITAQGSVGLVAAHLEEGSVLDSIAITNSNVRGDGVVTGWGSTYAGMVVGRGPSSEETSFVSNVYVLDSHLYSEGNDSGGLVGWISWSDTLVQNSYIADSTVEGGSAIGTIIGHSDGLAAEKTIWNTETVIDGGGVSYDGSNDGIGNEDHGDDVAQGLLTSEMKVADSYPNEWDIVSKENFDGETWYIEEGEDYPRLGWELEE